MGFRHAGVLAAVSFFLGVLFIAFNVDRRILYSGHQPSEEDYVDAFKFYTTFYEAPLAIKALIHAVMGLGVISIVGKLHRWDESAVFFDGSSLALFIAGIIIYLSVTIPTLQTIVNPIIIPEQQQHDTAVVSDQREAIGVLSAGNTLIIGCLIGVLGLQAGQEYARRVDARELAKVQQEEREEEATKRPVEKVKDE